MVCKSAKTHSYPACLPINPDRAHCFHMPVKKVSIGSIAERTRVLRIVLAFFGGINTRTSIYFEILQL